MKAEKNLQEAKVFVSTYKKYNNGDLSGEWLSIRDYKNYIEFIDACNKLHKDEGEEPELMFQDWEGIPDQLIKEYGWINEAVWPVTNWLCEQDDTTVEAFCEYVRYMDVCGEDGEDLIEEFESRYVGAYESEKEFAYVAVEEFEDKLPEIAQIYFDYEAYARDIFINSYIFSNGFVFHRAA